MAYGTDNGTMGYGYGGPKNVTPAIVSDARELATTVINGYLNRSEDLATPGTMITNAANWIAGTWIKNRDMSPIELLEMAKILLETIKDDINIENATKWGNVRFVSRDL